jgi:hypothetical protein
VIEKPGSRQNKGGKRSRGVSIVDEDMEGQVVVMVMVLMSWDRMLKEKAQRATTTNVNFRFVTQKKV